MSIAQSELSGALQKSGLRPALHSPLAHLEGHAEPGAWWPDHQPTLAILANPKVWLPLRINRAVGRDWIHTTLAESEQGAAALQQCRQDYQLILADSLEEALETTLSQFLKMEPIAESQDLSKDAYMTLLAASDVVMVTESLGRPPAPPPVLSEALLRRQWQDGRHTLNNRSAVAAAHMGPPLLPTDHTWKAGLQELETIGWLKKITGGYQFNGNGEDYALNLYALHASIHVPERASLYLGIDSWLVEFAGPSVRIRGAVPAELLAFACRERSCSACQQSLQPDDLFCTHCGTRYQP